jgi:hypothetical protein
MDLMNFKEIKIEVDRLLLAGHRKDDVFNRMSNKGVTNDKLAFIIAQYADPRRIEANKTWIKILLTLVFIQAVISFFVGLGQGVNSNSDVAWLWGVGGAFLPLACWLNIYKNIALGYSIYLVSLMLSLAGAKDIAKTAPSAALIAVGLIVGIGGYVWFVKRKVFPDIVLTKARKVNDVYVFTEWNTNRGPFSSEPKIVNEPFSPSYKSKVNTGQVINLRKPKKTVILYLILYVWLFGLSITDTAMQKDRQAILDLMCIAHAGAIICILFSIFYFKPKYLLFIFKSVPVLLVGADILWWYHYVPMWSHYSGSDLIQGIISLILDFCLTVIPAWYICFRFAYTKDIK